MTEQYGRRLMVSVLEYQAQHHPHHLFALVPSSSDLQEGFRQVTYREMKIAVDHAVHLLQAEFGNFCLHETVSYVGVPDLRYNAVFYAALKLRLKVFFPSPRNPSAINASLLEQTQCKKLIYTRELGPVVQKLQDSVTSLHSFQMPPLEELLVSKPVTVPYSFIFEDVRHEPILVLHSSGSTGMPKPVTMTHGTFATIDNDRNFPTIAGRRNHDLTTWDFPNGGCIYVPFPPFHLAGFLNNIMLPLYSRTIPIFGPAMRLPSGALVAQILRTQDVRGCFLPPTLAAQLYHEPDGPVLLKRLEVLCYGGGALPEAVGNELVKHITLCQFYGSTEVGQVRQLLPQKENWQYLEFHPASKQELQPSDDDAYELVLYADETTEDFSALNHNFPGIREYRTNDLFRPHPTKPGLWKFHARRDDIVVLSTGEKLNPTMMESGLEAFPAITGAIVAGQGEQRVALLVELSPDHGLGPDPLEGLWPLVTELNAKVPTQGRVSKSMILIADSKRPFVRAGKGTVVRKLTLAVYEHDLKVLFERSVNRSIPKQLKATAFRLDDVKELLHSVLQDSLDGQALDDAENLYFQGLDSVKSIETIERLKESLYPHAGESLSWLTPDILYQYSTVNEVSSVITQWLNTGSAPKQEDRAKKAEDLFNHYKALLPSSAISEFNDPAHDKLNVILLGSTGYLGKYMLTLLSREPRVSQIFCLNRSSTAEEQWTPNPCPASSEEEKKVRFLQVNFRAPKFALPHEVYEELKEKCDVILHSAWQVNFVLPVSAFRDSLEGLLNSIKLAASSKRHPRLFFISSIASTGVFSPLGAAKTTISEDIVQNVAAAMRTGYGESKHIGERLVSAARIKSGISASVLRLGQIVPASPIPDQISDIQWPTMDSLKSLLITSKMLQVLPSDLLDIDWLPVDIVARVSLAIIKHDCLGIPETDKVRIYNLVNPVTTPWSEILPTVQIWCGQKTVTKPLKEWIGILKSQHHNHDLRRLPAVSLLSFLELLSSRGPGHDYSQRNLCELQDTCEIIKPISNKDVETWLAALS